MTSGSESLRECQPFLVAHRYPQSHKGGSQVRGTVRADCYPQRLYAFLLFENPVVDGIHRRSRLPGVVRYFVRVYTQESGLLYRPPREIHPLEVRPFPMLLQSVQRPDSGGLVARQTVFYTPSTITISEGEKIRGRLTCAPNTKNNRDLDITISYETGGVVEIVEYKMCVVFPLLCAGPPRFVNPTDRWVGVNCIFICNFVSLRHVVLAVRCFFFFFFRGWVRRLYRY